MNPCFVTKLLKLQGIGIHVVDVVAEDTKFLLTHRPPAHSHQKSADIYDSHKFAYQW